MIHHGSPMARRLREQQEERERKEKEERDFQANLLLRDGAKALKAIVEKEVQQDKPCIVCQAPTRERGVFVPTTEREKNVLGPSYIFVYALCQADRPQQGDAAAIARIDKMVVRKIMRERAARAKSSPRPH